MKTKKIKSILTMILTMVIIITCIPVTAFSADAPTIDTSADVSLILTKYEAKEGDNTTLNDTVTGKENNITDRKPMAGVKFTVLKFATLKQVTESTVEL